MRSYSASTALEEAKPEHVVFAFDTLISHLSPNVTQPSPLFHDAETALFVTWNVSPQAAGKQPRLRGCIGILEPRQLHKALRDYALTSALHDKRFAPITLQEVPGLECTVSLLSCFEEANCWDDWQVGVHGLVIEFSDPVLGCRRSATFLPEVAADHGWSHDDTMHALVRKAGYDGDLTDRLRKALRVTRYQSSKTTLTYKQYQACRTAAAEVQADHPLATTAVQA